LIERVPGAPTIAAYSPDDDVNVTVVREASVSDEELIAAFRDTLTEYLAALKEDGLPLPQPHHRVATVAA
jgi:hypothetical protein